MALGFILFALFCGFIIFVLALTLLSFFISIKFFIKYKKQDQNRNGKFNLSISIIGTLVGLFMVFILINGINIFTGNSSTIITKVLFTPEIEINNIEEIAQIEQSIGSYTSKMKLVFFKIHEELSPTIYSMSFNNIVEYVKRIKINSIILIVDNNRQDIINTGYTSDIIFKFKNNHNNLIEMVKLFRENNEVIMNKDSYDEIEGFICKYQINFDYKSVEKITIIYNIEIELENGEIIYVEEITNFKKEIVNEEH